MKKELELVSTWRDKAIEESLSMYDAISALSCLIQKLEKFKVWVLGFAQQEGKRRGRRTWILVVGEGRDEEQDAEEVARRLNAVWPYRQTLVFFRAQESARNPSEESLRSPRGGWGGGREPPGSNRASTPPAGKRRRHAPATVSGGKGREEEETDEEEEEEGGREAAARRWRPAPSSSPSPLWASENEGEEREELFFFFLFFYGWTGRGKEVSGHWKRREVEYIFVCPDSDKKQE